MNYIQSDQRRGAARAASATNAWIWAIVTLGYLLPWAIAASRGLRNSSAIFWLNLLLGFTGVGWVVALVMALGRHQVVAAPQVIVQQQQPAAASAWPPPPPEQGRPVGY